MNFTVEMVRSSDEAGGRDRFSCSLAVWEWFVELGKTFGWKPSGTTYVPSQPVRSMSAPIRHGYRPGDARDYKQVDAEDASAWAKALTEARHSSHFTSLLTVKLNDETAAKPMTSSTDAEPPIEAVIDEFIEYAFGGAFAFARAEIR